MISAEKGEKMWNDILTQFYGKTRLICVNLMLQCEEGLGYWYAMKLFNILV